MNIPKKLLTLSFAVLFCPLVFGQTSTKIDMNLRIGTLSEIVIPEPYTTVQIPVQILEMRDVPGRDKKVITVHPIIAERSKTNIRIYSQHYAFNIEVDINMPGAQPTLSLDLGRFISAETAWKSSQNPSGKNGKSTSSGSGSATNGHTNGMSHARPVDVFMRNLLEDNRHILRPNKYAPSIIKNRVVFAMDYVFSYDDKLVFKATLWNKSKVPYHILNMTVTYKEKRGVPAINQRETKSMTLVPFDERYTRKVVDPGQKSHIFYVTSKLSPQDTGTFNCLLIEKNGARNFDFNIPSYIE